MFRDFFSRLVGGNMKKKSASHYAFNRPKSMLGAHTFYKGLSYDNSYPSISRIVNEFMTIRPYAIDNNGKTIQDSVVMNKIYHPNQQMSGATFREALALLSLVFPKVYVLVWSYDEHGTPITGQKITPENLAGFTILEGVSEYYIGEEKYYRVGAKEYSENEIIELRSGVNPYDLSGGYSPTDAARKWASIDDYIASYQAGYFENGAVPAGQFIITAGSVEEYNNIVDNMQARHRGSGNNNNVVYVHRPIESATGKPVNAQIEWIPFAESNKNLDLKSLFDQANKKIDSIYGVPASVRGVNDNNTYASVRVDEQIFIKYTIKPFATRIWSEFTHQLNRITGGLGFAITFDLDIPGVAEEEKIEAERKAAELTLIKTGLEMGYSLDSIVDAFELSNGYKTLKLGEAPLKIENDKPEVDDGGEVEESPEDLNAKSVHICNEHGDHHCLKAEAKTKNEKQKDKDQNALETVFRDMTNEQIERAIDSDFEDFDFGDKDREKFKQRIKVILLSVLVTRGVVAWSDLASILKQNNISTDDLTEFKISDKLKKHYDKMITDFTKSFSEDTARSIVNRVAQAETEDWNKEELARSLRDITKVEEWRIQRIARTETHRAHGLAGVEAGVQIQNESGVQIYKEWVVVSANPCKYCRGMDGRRVNVAESYVKKGGILIGKSKIRVNDYANIDTAGAHPNCSCVEKFGIEENNNEPWRSVEIEELPAEKFNEVYGKGWKDFSFETKPPLSQREREIAQIFSAQTKKTPLAIRRVEKPDGIKTPDLLIDDKKFEIKKVSSPRSVEDQLRKARKQGAFGVILDIDDEKYNFKYLATEIKRRQKQFKIEEVYKILNNEIVD